MKEMNDNAEIEFTECTYTLLEFIIDLFINSSERISEILLLKSKNIIHKSDWKDGDEIFNLQEKWQTNSVPPMLSLQGIKYMKLHDSPYNLVFRSLKGGTALIGVKFTIKTVEILLFSIINQLENWQLSLTAMKDILQSIIQLGQNMTKITVTDSYNIEIGNNYVKDKKSIKKLIESLDILEFICDYTDRGDSLKLNFKYEKREKIRYPDSMYK